MNEKSYSIGAVAKMTGLSTQVIRIWEHRYNAVVAARSANGRRVYCNEEVGKLNLLKALTDRGVAISTIANLDTEQLRERLSDMDQMATGPLERPVRVGALGATVTDLLSREVVSANPIELVLGSADALQFSADLKQQSLDVLVIETINLGTDCLQQARDLRGLSGNATVIMTYAFGRSADERRLAEDGIRLLRVPLCADNLAIAILAANNPMAAEEKSVESPTAARPGPELPKDAPRPRRFSPQDLIRLSSIQTEVDCECPQHLATVLQTLSAFEVYSAQCESRDEQDAELHAQLHRSTAQARALMEDALTHLMDVEGLTLKHLG